MVGCTDLSSHIGSEYNCSSTDDGVGLVVAGLHLQVQSDKESWGLVIQSVLSV